MTGASGEGAGTPGGVDFDYLEGFAAGDMVVVTEVLNLFQGQAAGWLAELDAPPSTLPAGRWRDLAHTIKGASRGIGAGALADVADRAERGDPAMAGELRAALVAARADIEGYLSRIGGG
ncbi:Hpt domain-containing protein [Phenylobacterium sp.]|uniref:Hpt domain-containing protein n=1 Tax=Phenylobacterium sp. TaxID=1871053 RepID=UPI00301C864F